jgi:phosphoribosylformylglycinamidine cyclo-ligase
MTDERYHSRGVSASKEDVHNAIKNVDKGLFPQAFCKIVPDYLTGDEEYCIVMHADGAGTKSALAYLYWIEWNGLLLMMVLTPLKIWSRHTPALNILNMTRK